MSGTLVFSFASCLLDQIGTNLNASLFCCRDLKHQCQMSIFGIFNVFLRRVLPSCKFGAKWIMGGRCAPNTWSGSSSVAGTAEFKDRWRAVNFFSLQLLGAHQFPHIPFLNCFSNGLYSWTLKSSGSFVLFGLELPKCSSGLIQSLNRGVCSRSRLRLSLYIVSR